MQTRRTGHLCQTLDRCFDILARHQHQVGHLVNDDDDKGQRLHRQFLIFKDRLAGFRIKSGLNAARKLFALGGRFLDAFVIARDVTHAHLAHGAITVFHFAHRPFQGDDCLVRVGHNRGQKMRDAVIDRQFQHFRVNHDKAAFFGLQTIKQ